MRYYRAYLNLRLELADVPAAKQLVQMAIAHWQLQAPQFSDGRKVVWCDDFDKILEDGAAKYRKSQFESSELTIRDAFGTELSFTWINDRNTIHNFNAVSQRVEQVDHATKNLHEFCAKAKAIYAVFYPSTKKHSLLELKLGTITFLSRDLINQLKLKSEDLSAIPNTDREENESGVILRGKSGWNISKDLEETRVAQSIKWPFDFPRELHGVKSGGKTPDLNELLGNYKQFIKNAGSYAFDLLKVPADQLRNEHLPAVLEKYDALGSDSPDHPTVYRQIVAAFGTIICNETGGSWVIRGFFSKKLMISTDRNLIASRYEVTELLDEFAGNEEMRVAFLSQSSYILKSR